MKSMYLARSLLGLVVVLALSLHLAVPASAAVLSTVQAKHAVIETGGCGQAGPSNPLPASGCHSVHAFTGIVQFGAPVQIRQHSQPTAALTLAGIDPVRDDRPPSDEAIS
ncbi:hypothetical protein PV773_19965 [Mesorhizobium sp. CC13]|uniref:hypothetical protein n=1 Tax=Mesorhizobium sp. CC13 TaxID=3029194 RepID=UPI003267E1C6